MYLLRSVCICGFQFFDWPWQPELCSPADYDWRIHYITLQSNLKSGIRRHARPPTVRCTVALLHLPSLVPTQRPSSFPNTVDCRTPKTLDTPHSEATPPQPTTSSHHTHHLWHSSFSSSSVAIRISHNHTLLPLCIRLSLLLISWIIGFSLPTQSRTHPHSLSLCFLPPPAAGPSDPALPKLL